MKSRWFRVRRPGRPGRAGPAALGGVILALALGGPLAAQGGGAGAGGGASLNIPFERYTLANGLEVILAPDKASAVVTVDVWYHVGSRNERAGRTGFAHLFEHMMFQGSGNVGKGQHMQLVERAGGQLNGSTTEDRTNYFETLPANRVNLGLWLEADRMRSLAVTQANLDNQREVVKEEKRMRVDNSPYGTAINAARFTAPYSATCGVYAHTVIGSMEDLNAAKLEDVQDFFATYYAPNNATMTVAGDFEPAQVKALVQQYFGSIPSHAAPAGVTCEKPFTELPRKLEIPDVNAKLPAVVMTYGAVAAGDADEPALSLLATILGQGESSRLNERLVKQERAALQAGTLFEARRGPGVLWAYAVANQGVDPAKLQGLVEDEVAKLGKEGVTVAELEKAKAQYRANALDQLQTSMGKAEALNRAAVFRGDPALARTELARYAAVTQADIQRVASKYLVPGNVAVIVAQPQSGKGVTP